MIHKLVNTFICIGINNIMSSHNLITIDNNNNIPLCSICNNDFKTISDPESGEIICNICGIVLSDEEKELPLHPRVQEEMTVISHTNTTNTNLQFNENNSNNNNSKRFNIE